MNILKKVLISALGVGVGLGSLSAFAACDDNPQDENTFDPVGTYAFYSLQDGEHTYTVGQTGTIENVTKTFFKETFLFTFHADGTAEYFIFGAEEMQYGAWEESEEGYTVRLTMDETVLQATGNDEFLSWTDKGWTYTLQKTELAPTDAYDFYYGIYSFFSLTVNGVEYLEGENYLDLKTLSKEDYKYRVLPNGFLQVSAGEKEYLARWEVQSGKLSFLLPYGYGAKSYTAVINSVLGELSITLENNDGDEPINEYWVFHQGH